MLSGKKQSKKGKRDKDTLHNPKILNVNLIKDEIRVSFDWSKNISLLIIVLFVTGLFITEIYFGLDWWEKQEKLRTQALDERTLMIEREVSALKINTEQALAYQNKTSELTSLLNNHIYWTKFFSWLERKTLSTVSYNNFSGDLTGKYSLDATTGTFADVSWQVKAFLDDPITLAAGVGNAGMTKDDGDEGLSSVDFVLGLEFNPDIFKQ